MVNNQKNNSDTVEVHYEHWEIVLVKNIEGNKRKKRIFIKRYDFCWFITSICIKKKDRWNYIMWNTCKPYWRSEIKKHKWKIYAELNYPPYPRSQK